MNKTKLPNTTNLDVATPMKEMKEKKPVKLVAILLLILLVLALISFLVLRLGKNNTIANGFAWCQSGNTLKLDDATLTAVGVEDYQSPQYEDKVCHLKYFRDNGSSELYLDETALIAFPKTKEKTVGSGCVVYPVDKIGENAQLCFGSKIKNLPTRSAATITQAPTANNFAGTKWRYEIQVGGGVGGIMTFERDDNGSLKGSFTENGPEGQKTKNFIGSREEGLFLLTLEEFPTFEISLSEDNKTMTGKPIEPEKDIVYPDDFFKATRE